MRSVTAQDGLREQLDAVKLELKKNLDEGRLPGFLRNLVAAHDQGEHACPQLLAVCYYILHLQGMHAFVGLDTDTEICTGGLAVPICCLLILR